MSSRFSLLGGHVAHLTAAGNVYTYGSGKKFELGHGAKKQYTTKPEKVEGLPPVKQVALGAHHSAVLTESGDVYTWGWGGGILDAGALGHPGNSDCPVPKQVEGFNKIVQIATGAHHTLALTESGSVLSWGRGEIASFVFGGNRAQQAKTFDFLQNYRVVKVAAGENFSAVLTADNRVFIWGGDACFFFDTICVGICIAAGLVFIFAEQENTTRPGNNY